MQIIIHPARSSDIMSSCLGDEDALNRMAMQPETLSRVDERGWIPLHKAAVHENKRILEIIFSGNNNKSNNCDVCFFFSSGELISFVFGI